MSDSFLEKQHSIKNLLSNCKTNEMKYQKIIELGKFLSHFPLEDKTEENRVTGCQSLTYLKSECINGCMKFTACSDALISAGLAALLIMIYNDESPETLLKCPLLFFEDLKILPSLTPNRANGLYHMHLKMKKDALSKLIQPL